jgi:hypothetical protein
MFVAWICWSSNVWRPPAMAAEDRNDWDIQPNDQTQHSGGRWLWRPGIATSGRRTSHRRRACGGRRSQHRRRVEQHRRHRGGGRRLRWPRIATAHGPPSIRCPTGVAAVICGGRGSQRPAAQRCRHSEHSAATGWPRIATPRIAWWPVGRVTVAAVVYGGRGSQQHVLRVLQRQERRWRPPSAVAERSHLSLCQWVAGRQ